MGQYDLDLSGYFVDSKELENHLSNGKNNSSFNRPITAVASEAKKNEIRNEIKNPTGTTVGKSIKSPLFGEYVMNVVKLDSDSDNGNNQTAFREELLENLYKIDCKHFQPLIEAFIKDSMLCCVYLRSGSSLYILMMSEWISDPLNDSEAKDIAFKVHNSLKYLHAHGMIHSNLNSK